MDKLADEIANLKELNSQYYDDRYEQAQQIKQLKAELDKIKTVEFPKKIEAVAQNNFVRGLERAKELIRPMVSHKVTDAIQAEINKASTLPGRADVKE